MGAHVSSHPEPPSHLPYHPITLGCPRAPALSALLHASNLHWSSILHVVVYIFQCYSLKSSHTHLLPHSAKVLEYRIVMTVFLNSIYIYIYMYIYKNTVLKFLFLTSLCMIGSSFIHLIRTDSNTFFFIAE